MKFPSPRGDKLCLNPYRSNGALPEFPSPRGDKLCHAITIGEIVIPGFPSPRGDKLCPIIVDDDNVSLFVSVPSRG